MTLSPWLLLALAVLVIGGLILFIWWRRRQQIVLIPVCLRCMASFDEKTWKKRNVREHYHGRYTIVPVYVCPRCGHKMARGSDGKFARPGWP